MKPTCDANTKRRKKSLSLRIKSDTSNLTIRRMKRIQVLEKREITARKPIVLVGLPDVGLVGVIAVSHIVSSLNLPEIGYVKSETLPPIAVLHGGLPYAPIRVFGKGELIAILSETAVPASAIKPLADMLVNWAESKNASRIVLVSGITEPARPSIEKPEVFCAASDPETLKAISNLGVSIMNEGFIVGPHAVILQECAERQLSAVVLLSQAFYNLPDPQSAAMIIDVLNRLLNLRVDASPLIERGEEIRLRARDVMRRTQAEMERMRKSQELASPLVV